MKIEELKKGQAVFYQRTTFSSYAAKVVSIDLENKCVVVDFGDGYDFLNDLDVQVNLMPRDTFNFKDFIKKLIYGE